MTAIKKKRLMLHNSSLEFDSAANEQQLVGFEALKKDFPTRAFSLTQAQKRRNSHESRNATDFIYWNINPRLDDTRLRMRPKSSSPFKFLRAVFYLNKEPTENNTRQTLCTYFYLWIHTQKWLHFCFSSSMFHRRLCAESGLDIYAKFVRMK